MDLVPEDYERVFAIGEVLGYLTSVNPQHHVRSSRILIE